MKVLLLLLLFTFHSLSAKETQLIILAEANIYSHLKNKRDRPKVDSLKLAIINRKGEIIWSFKKLKMEGFCHVLKYLGKGKILVQTSPNEISIVDIKEKKIEWKYHYDGYIFSAMKLKNGRIAVSHTQKKTIAEIDSKGNIQNEVPFIASGSAGRYIRQFSVTSQDNYLMAHEGNGIVREYSKKGKVIWEYKVGSKVFSASRLENGNTLIGTGDGHKVIEVTPKKEIIWELSSKDLPFTMNWITEVHSLSPNELLVVNCHPQFKAPQMFIVNKKKKVLWKYQDFRFFGNGVSNVAPLDIAQSKELLQLINK